MKFVETDLAGALLIEPDPVTDDRGFFARQFSRERMAEIGLMDRIVEVYDSFNAKRGTLRGIHYQLPPFAETKIIRCVRGRVYDIILDLRPDSPTFGKSFGAELSDENRISMYAPRGFAHGFIALSDDAELFYFVDEVYSAEHARGIRWNDPRFGIQWPMTPSLISERDRQFPDFDSAFHLS